MIGGRQQKMCNSCRCTKPLGHFYKDNKGKVDKRQPYCIDCAKELIRLSNQASMARKNRQKRKNNDDCV